MKTIFSISIDLEHLRLAILKQRYRRGWFLGVKGLFWCPINLHVPYVFVARVQNEIHIANLACWLQLKYTCVIQSKFTHTKKTKTKTPNKISNLVGVLVSPGSAFDILASACTLSWSKTRFPRILHFLWRVIICRVHRVAERLRENTVFFP